MKEFFSLILLSILSCASVTAQSILDRIDVQSDLVAPKHYIITKTAAPLTIDGRANERAWQQAAFTKKFIDIEGVKQPKFETRTKMLWDDNYLYVYAELEEPHIWADLKKRDAIIYYNNDFEIFLDPSGTTMNYGEIEINALNTVWDLYLNKPYRVGGGPNFSWNLDQLQSAVQIYGTLNKSNDIDSLWTVEMAIPLRPLLELKNRPRILPKEGEQWRINFSRVEWDFDLQNGIYSRKKEDGKYLREYNWVWSNQKVINMHEPEKWGYLQFTTATSANGIEYKADPDQEIKQTIYALFRQTKGGKLKWLQKKQRGYQQELIVSYAEEKTITTTFHRTHFGFEYELKSPLTQIAYIINEEGILKSKP